MQKNIVITGGSLQASSHGIVALVLGAISAIRKSQKDVQFIIIGGRYAESQVSGRDIELNIGEPVREYMIRARHYPWLLLRAVIGALLPGSLRERLFSATPPLQALAQADAVVSLSAGDSFSDIYGYRQFLGHYLVDLMAVLLGRPLIFAPQTVGPFNTWWGRALAGFLLHRAKMVFTRESFSTATAQSLLGRRDTVVEKADLAFLMAPELIPLPAQAPGRPRVGINVSGFMYFSSVAKTLMAGFDYAEFMAQLVVDFIQRYEADVWLIPHDFETGGQQSDLLACRILLQRLDVALRERVTLIDQAYWAPQLKGIIGTCDFFIGARLHACIAAASMRVPVVPIAYSYKFCGVMQKIGLEKAVCDPCKETPEVMRVKIHQAFEDRRAFQQCVEEALPEIEAQAASWGEFLTRGV